jgi:hypothetical protein
MADLRSFYAVDDFFVRHWWLPLTPAALGLAVASTVVALVSFPAAVLVVVMGVMELFLAFMAGVRYCERIRSLSVVGRWTRVEAAETTGDSRLLH